MKHPPLEPGIYFKLPSEIYHNDPAISRSGIVDLLDTPNTYWKNSWMNPARVKEKPSKAMIRGQAFDCLLFEPALFSKRFRLDKVDVIDPKKTVIDLATYHAICDSIKILRAGEDSHLFLSKGIPHVTIVFDWMGFRFRCEHDYFMHDCSSDFKSVYSLEDYHLKKSFREYGLDIQQALYKKSREEFKKAYTDTPRRAEVYGDVDPAFFKKFMETELNSFIFIMQRDSAPYPYDPIFTMDDTEESGLKKIDKAMAVYIANMKKYGPDKEWPVCSGKVRIFSMFYGSE